MTTKTKRNYFAMLPLIALAACGGDADTVHTSETIHTTDTVHTTVTVNTTNTVVPEAKANTPLEALAELPSITISEHVTDARAITIDARDLVSDADDNGLYIIGFAANGAVPIAGDLMLTFTARLDVITIDTDGVDANGAFDFADVAFADRNERIDLTIHVYDGHDTVALTIPVAIEHNDPALDRALFSLEQLSADEGDFVNADGAFVTSSSNDLVVVDFNLAFDPGDYTISASVENDAAIIAANLSTINVYVTMPTEGVTVTVSITLSDGEFSDVETFHAFNPVG